MLTQANVSVRAVDAETVRPLRGLVLRRGTPPEMLVYEGDDHPHALHAAAFADDHLIGIASIHPEAPTDDLKDEIPAAAYEEGASFRLRGMATHQDARRRGVGTALLKTCFDFARSHGARFMWCNARVTAIGFYESFDFRVAGDEFAMPDIGRHFVMWRAL